MTPLGDDGVAGVLQGFQAAVAAVLDDEFESARGAEAVDRRGAEDVHQPVLDLLLEAGLQPGGQRRTGQLGVGAAMEVVQHHVHGAEIGGIGVQQDRLAGDGHGVLDPFRAIGDGLDAAHDLLRPLDRRGVGQLHVHQQVALVLGGNEARRRVGEAPPGQRQQAAVNQQHQHAHPQQPAHGPAIKVGRVVEAAIEEAEGPAEQVVQRPGEEPGGQRNQGRGDPRGGGQQELSPLGWQPRERQAEPGRQKFVAQPGAQQGERRAGQDLVGRLFRSLRPQQQGRQRRTERQRIEGRNQRRNRDRQGELPEELARDAADERAGHEHRAEDQPHGDHRPRDLRHGLDRGLARARPSLDIVLHGLDHDDGVVDDDADGQHQAEEREVVQAEARWRPSRRRCR